LWTSRLLKTRAAANEAVKGNLVRLNGTPVKPSREVAVGDEVRITLGPLRRTVIVRGMAQRRVSASAAAELYAETPESLAARERLAEQRRLSAPRIEAGGRPTKRDRRRYRDSGGRG
jgi:ribosome-associated heat shock protein Hsp15